MKDSYIDGFNSYIEIEKMIQRGNFNFYGFTDIRFNENNGSLNYDFYKYTLKYDITDSKELLFINLSAKDTYSSFSGDSFLGIGSHIDIPVFGRLYANAYYFLNYIYEDNNSKSPISFGFNWFNVLSKNIITNWDLAHGGWSDIDFYTNVKDNSNSRSSIQVYESLSLQHKDYAVELGYKYWVMDVKNNYSHSLYLSLIKKF